MQTVPTLLASASNVLGTLFWLLLAAALVWLLIWRLLRSDDSDTPTESDSSDPDSGTVLPADEPSRESNAGADSAAPSAAEETSEEDAANDDSTDSEESRDNPSPDPKASDAGGAEDTGADSPPVLDTATAEEAAAQFQADLDSGKARQDEALGILYDSEPDDSDDLKEIKGVGKVLDGKLHDFGIYKFKQIAFWTDTAAAEFAQRLTFKDRIYRDDWIAQAKSFHEKKHGEKL